MATYKCTAVFKLTTNLGNPNSAIRRIGGWTESWYKDEATLAAVKDSFEVGECWCSKRAALLPIGCAIIGQRYQVVNPVGPSAGSKKTFPGSSTLKTDVPQMALMLRVPALTVRNVRTLILRGLPDDRVKEGEYVNDTTYDQALRRFLDWLGNFKFKGRDLSQVQIPMVGTDANDLVTTTVNHGFNPGDYVRIARTKRSDDGVLTGGRFQVLTTPTPTTFKTTPQPFGVTTGGTVRKDLTIYPSVDILSIGTPEVVVRKVGRPSGGYRGRASKKKR